MSQLPPHLWNEMSSKRIDFQWAAIYGPAAFSCSSDAAVSVVGAGLWRDAEGFDDFGCELTAQVEGLTKSVDSQLFQVR